MADAYQWTPGLFKAETQDDLVGLGHDLYRARDYMFIQGQSLASLLEKKNFSGHESDPKKIVLITNAIIKEVLLDKIPGASNKIKEQWAQNMTKELSQKGCGFLAINSLKSEFTPLKNSPYHQLQDKKGDTSRAVSIELDKDNKLSVLSTGAINKSHLMPNEIECPRAPDGLPWVKAFARTSIDLNQDGTLELAQPQCSLFFNQTESDYSKFLLNPNRNDLRWDTVDDMKEIKQMPASSPELKVEEYQQMLMQFKQELAKDHSIRPVANQNNKPTLAEQQVAIIDASLAKIQENPIKSEALNNSMEHLAKHVKILEKNYPLKELKISQLVKALFQRFFSSKTPGQELTEKIQGQHQQFVNFKKSFQEVSKPKSLKDNVETAPNIAPKSGL